MIDPSTFDDWSTLGAFTAIFAMAVAACSYHLGRRHSYWHGYHIGKENARRQFLPRLMRAKIDAQRAGRILGLREALRLTHRPAAGAPTPAPPNAATNQPS